MVVILQAGRKGSGMLCLMAGHAHPSTLLLCLVQADGLSRLCTAACRKAYQQAVGIPTSALDALWRAYEAFESSGTNKQFVQRVLAEHRPSYTAARSALNELRRRMGKIRASTLAAPPGASCLWPLLQVRHADAQLGSAGWMQLHAPFAVHTPAPRAWPKHCAAPAMAPFCISSSLSPPGGPACMPHLQLHVPIRAALHD